jgi:hypothetical protein
MCETCDEKLKGEVKRRCNVKQKSLMSSSEVCCYICYGEFTQEDAIYDPECECSSHGMLSHYKCLRDFCESTGNVRCTICKSGYNDLEVTLKEEDEIYVDYVTYRNGMKDGVRTRMEKSTNSVVYRQYYKCNILVEACEYNEVTGKEELLLRFDREGRVTEYIRYNSWGEEVDYEDYSGDAKRQMEVMEAYLGC